MCICKPSRSSPAWNTLGVVPGEGPDELYVDILWATA